MNFFFNKVDAHACTYRHKKSVELAHCQFHVLRPSHCLEDKTDNTKSTPIYKPPLHLMYTYAHACATIYTSIARYNYISRRHPMLQCSYLQSLKVAKFQYDRTERQLNAINMSCRIHTCSHLPKRHIPIGSSPSAWLLLMRVQNYNFFLVPPNYLKKKLKKDLR